MNTKPPKPRESKVQAAIRARLQYRFGITLWRRNVGAMNNPKGQLVRFAAPGQSDLYGVLPPSHGARHVEIETKRMGMRPTPAQLRWLRHMTQLGCVAFWADDPSVADRVVEAIMKGGRIVWRDGSNYDVEMPP